MRWTAPPSAGVNSPNRRRRTSGWRRSSNSYLTPAHRDDPGHGCAVPTLGAEIARESPKTRKAFAAKLEQMIDMLAEQIPDVPRKAARKQAMATIATMMGTLVLARVAGNGEFSDEILDAGREAALGRAAACEACSEEDRRPKRPSRDADEADAVSLRYWSKPLVECPDVRAGHAFSQIRCACKTLSKRYKDCKMPPNSALQAWEERMRSIGHFIGGKHVKGTSGRTADVFEPMTGDVQAKVALASKAEVARGGRERQGRAAGMGRDQSAAPGSRPDEVPGTGRARQRRAGRIAGARARQDHSRRQGRHPARRRGRRVRARHSAD